jgi:dihydrolipoamide dehydrogenase
MTEHFDIAVIGTGPGGYVAALKAAQMGAKVAAVEASRLGGACLNNGCIPSKVLLASAELMYRFGHASDLGVKVEGDVSIDWAAVQKRKDKIIKTLRGGIGRLFAARNVRLFSGRAGLNGPGKVLVDDGKGSKEEFTGKKVIVAVGSVPIRFPGWPDDPNRVCTTDEALHWATLPKSVLIVGGGVIGCEFACMMQPLGVNVVIVEMMPHLLPGMDEQIAETIEKIFTKRGITVYTSTKVEELATTGSGCRALLTNGKIVETERTLVSVGRRANTADIGLETVGLETDRGFIRVNDRMETAVQGIYCVGDANGRCLLAHAASAQGVSAVKNALGYDEAFTAPIPGAVYTFPEIGSVGRTEQEARAEGIPLSIGAFPIGYLGKAMAVNDTEGFAKVLRHRETGDLLGVHIIGHNATECIAAAVALLHKKVKVEEVAEVVVAHPTIGESLKEAAEDALGAALHLPPRRILRVMAGT